MNAATQALRLATRGAVFTEGDDGYDRARAVWNGSVRRRPSVVVRCVDADDIAAAVRVARDHGLPLSVRGGGHDWSGRAVRTDGLMVDLGMMRVASVDAATGTASVGGGVRAGDLVAAGHTYGLVPVTGTVKAVGLLGLTLGGGYGLLAGAHGLALDNLLRARVVLADGEQVTASVTEHPDLFWALRGGGGNFGIVAQAWYRVHPIPRLLSGLLLFSLADAERVLREFREVLAGAPDELTVMSGFFSDPQGTPLLFLLPAWSGEPGAGEPHLRRLRSLGRPVADLTAPMAYQDILGMFDDLVVDGRQNEMRTRWLPGLTDETAAALVAAAARMTSPLSGMYLHHFHGAATRVDPADTAFALRDDHLLAEIVATWEDPDGAAPHRAWAEKVTADLAGVALPGGYANLLGPDEPDRVLAGYGGNRGRLLELKRRFDPDGVFSAVPTLPADHD